MNNSQGVETGTLPEESLVSARLALADENPKLAALSNRVYGISGLSADFLVLLSCSTLIATLGLYQNSPAVIIGAMIIAPLMRPLVGLSLATLTADTKLLRRALVTLAVGTAISVFLSCTLGFILHTISLTPEMLARTRPNLLDLAVAIFAGAVGAYCQTRDDLADSLAGVAIAVALVPPLSVVGVGLSMSSYEIWGGAALLYITNLVGIAFAGIVVFIIMGYTPIHRVGKGVIISLAVLGLVMVPLGFGMYELLLENHLSRKIQEILKEKTYTFRDLRLQSVEVRRFNRPMRVIATVYGAEEAVTPLQVKLVQDFLIKETGIPIEFRLRIVPLEEIRALEVSSEKTRRLEVPAIPPVDPTLIHPGDPDLMMNPLEPELELAPSGPSPQPSAQPEQSKTVQPIEIRAPETKQPSEKSSAPASQETGGIQVEPDASGAKPVDVKSLGEKEMSQVESRVPAISP